LKSGPPIIFFCLLWTHMSVCLVAQTYHGHQTLLYEAQSSFLQNLTLPTFYSRQLFRSSSNVCICARFPRNGFQDVPPLFFFRLSFSVVSLTTSSFRTSIFVFSLVTSFAPFPFRSSISVFSLTTSSCSSLVVFFPVTKYPLYFVI
jgi:hypothetical protein